MATKDRWEPLIDKWIERVQRIQHIHSNRASLYHVLHMGIGIPTAVLNAVVGTTVFAGLTTSDDIVIKIAAGTVSLVVAGLIGYQSFASLEGKSQEHKNAAKRYESFAIELEFRKQFPPKNDADAEKIFSELQRTFSDLPPIAVRYTFKRVKKFDPTLCVSGGGSADQEYTVKVPNPVSPIGYGLMLWHSTEDHWKELDALDNP